MSNTLRLETDKKPTYFNKEAAIGFFLFPLLLGPVIGGMIGKRRMENELQDGKEIHENHSWLNKETWLGAELGAVAGHLASFLLLGKTTAGIAVATGAGSLVLPVMAIGAVGMLAGAYIGNLTDKKHHNAEYEQAQKQTVVRELSQNLSPEVSKAMEYAVEHHKGWAKNVTEKRALASSASVAG